MLDFWLKLKVWTEYIIPVTIITFIFVSTVLVGLIESYRLSRKTKWLTKNGYERFLKDVSEAGGFTYYAWKKSGCKTIDEHDLKRWSYKHLKNITK